MSGWLSGITEGIAVSIEHIATGLGSILDKLTDIRTALVTKFDDITKSFSDNFQKFFDWTAEIRQFFLDKFKELGEWITGNWKKFFDWTAEIRQFFLDKFTSLFTKLLDIRQAVLDLPGVIYTKLWELFEKLFIPDEELMNTRLTALREKFTFVDSLTGYGEHLLGCLQSAAGTKAPVVTINLGAYEGRYNWGGGKVVLDFSWYARYKPMVDNLLAGIIWINWLWHVYKRIPEIIHGSGMTVERATDIARGIDE